MNSLGPTVPFAEPNFDSEEMNEFVEKTGFVPFRSLKTGFSK